MVKQIFVVAGLSAVIAAAMLIDLALEGRSETPDSGPVSCPIYFDGSFRDILPNDHVASHWEVYREDGERGTANVKVSASTIATPGTPYSCQLAIRRAPDTPGRASDWRIGQVVKPDGLRGKTVRYRVSIRSDAEIRLDTGQIYVYDGYKVQGAAIPHLTPEWRTFEATLTVDPKATTFEVWLRLLIGQGTVRPGYGTLYFVPQIEIHGD